MNIKHTIKTAIRAIMDHKSRSILTVLGIVIGVASVIIVMSLGSGVQALVLNKISGLGPESVVLRSGSGLGDLTSVLYSNTLVQKDLDAISKKSNVPNLKEVAPYVMVSGGSEYDGKKFFPSISGGPVEFLADVFEIGLDSGEYYSDTDTDQRKRVAVIGHDLKDEMFENRNAIGEDIQIRGKKFEVIGVFEKTADAGPFPFNEIIMIPHTAAQDITGTEYFLEMIIMADSEENVNKLVADIEMTLRDTHDLNFGEDNDFNIQTQENMIEMISDVIAILTYFLVAVVAISLIVGGVGIMNIMLVSVSERTKEIGLRKALGARRSDILKQFLFEAIVLTSLGGVIGTILGAVVSFGVAIILVNAAVPNWEFSFSLGAAVLGVGMSATIGLVFGTYPAVQASKKSPMEALRYE